jgi:uncharacterized protein YjiS (DUF1127 family)
MSTHRSTLRRLVRETVLYIGGSSRSRWQQLDRLRALDDHLLRDIGISRLDAASGTLRDRDIDGLSSGL